MSHLDIEPILDAIYRRMLDLVCDGQLDELSTVIDPEQYHEECVGITPGWIDYDETVASLRRFLPTVPGLSIDVMSITIDPDQPRLLAQCRRTVTAAQGRQTFDSIEVVTFGSDLRIVRRWQLPIGSAANS